MKKWSLVPLIFVISSCKPPETSDSSLTIVVGPNPVFALPVPMSSCQEAASDTPGQSLTAPTIELRNFKMTWKSTTKSAQISYIDITFTHNSLANGKYQCILAGDELSFILGSAGTIAANDSTEKSAACSLRCGSVTFKDNVQNAVVPGVIKVVGAEYDNEGNGVPFVTRSTLTLEKRTF